jgi:hypothetical protein
MLAQLDALGAILLRFVRNVDEVVDDAYDSGDCPEGVHWKCRMRCRRALPAVRKGRDDQTSRSRRCLVCRRPLRTWHVGQAAHVLKSAFLYKPPS